MSQDFDSLRLSQSPDATIIVDLEGTVVYWSKGSENLFGYKSDEAVGNLFDELVIPPDNREDERACFAAVIQQGASTRNSIRRRKDGSFINVLVSSKLLRKPFGESDYIISTKTDITQLIVQRDARVVEAKYGQLLDSMPDAIVMVNPIGRIVHANTQAESLFSYEHSELVGSSVELLMPERFKTGHVGFRTEYISQAKPRSMGVGLELAGLKKSGEEFPVEISLSPLHTDSGMLVMSAIRDISERKQIERAIHDKNVELMAAADAKNRFLANMSHELRTPLNGIIGFTEFMLDGKPGPVNAKQQEYLSDVLASGRHLLQLINDVLDLAKVEAGKIDLHPEVFSISKAISEVCAVVKPISQKKDLEIVVDTQPSADTVNLDKQKTKQILYNLISNAVKFSNSTGKVWVKVRGTEDCSLVLSVQDEGIGIKPEDVSRLFKEFEQLESGVERKYEGTGLGLALTQRIVEIQGGSIAVESDFGKGSTFTVSIPNALVSA